MTLTELRRRINALLPDNVGDQPAEPSEWAQRMVKRCRSLMIRRGRSVRTGGFAGLGITLLALLVWVGGRSVPPSNDLAPVQVPATVVSGSLPTVDLKVAEPDPARLERGPAVSEQGVGTRLVPEVLVTDEAQTPRLSVARSGVGTDVVDRELVGRSDSFAVSMRPTFWTHVIGGRPGDRVRHVWCHENSTVGVVDLAIGSSSWRTHSRMAVTEGDWVVEVWDVEGRVLARHEFRSERSRPPTPKGLNTCPPSPRVSDSWWRTLAAEVMVQLTDFIGTWRGCAPSFVEKSERNLRLGLVVSDQAASPVNA